MTLLFWMIEQNFASTDQHFADIGSQLSRKRHRQVQLVTSNGFFNETVLSDLMHHVETFFVTVVQEHDASSRSNTHFTFVMGVN